MSNLKTKKTKPDNEDDYPGNVDLQEEGNNKRKNTNEQMDNDEIAENIPKFDASLNFFGGLQQLKFVAQAVRGPFLKLNPKLKDEYVPNQPFCEYTFVNQQSLFIPQCFCGTGMVMKGSKTQKMLICGCGPKDEKCTLTINPITLSNMLVKNVINLETAMKFHLPFFKCEQCQSQVRISTIINKESVGEKEGGNTYQKVVCKRNCFKKNTRKLNIFLNKCICQGYENWVWFCKEDGDAPYNVSTKIGALLNYPVSQPMGKKFYRNDVLPEYKSKFTNAKKAKTSKQIDTQEDK